MIGHLRSRAPLAALAAVLALVASSHADGVESVDAAFKLLPADTAFYGSMLRNREQIEILANSKAWAKLMDLPAAKFARKEIEEKLANPDPQTAMVLGLLKQPENQELLEVVRDAGSEEIFVYGGSGWVDFSNLVVRLFKAGSGGPGLGGSKPVDAANPAEVVARMVLRSLAANINLIHTPDIVIGFKTKDPKKAEAQIKRLEDLIGIVIGAAPPPIQAGFKRVKVGSSSVLNLTLDGSLVPWNELHIKDYEDKDGEYDALLKKLQGLKLSISLGVHHSYIVLAIGQSPEQLAAIGGTGKRLNALTEFKPLAKYADKRITSIGYVSKALKATVTSTAEDFQSLPETVADLLKKADFPAEQAKQIRKQVESFAAELGKNLPEAGASVSFSFLTERGGEGYSYDYGTFPNGPDGSKPLTLAEHTGGHPILWLVGRMKTNPETYQKFAKAVSALFGPLEDGLLTKLDDDQKEHYQSVKKVVLPLVKRLDEITATQFLPATADGQFGFVLDAKWKSKHWLAAAPATPKAMPMPELGFAIGVSDEEKFQKAMKNYFVLINDILGAASELGMGQIPDLKLPEPTIENGVGGKLAYYPIPQELGLDAQVVPTAGLSKKVAVLTLSRAHTERLLKPTPLTIESGPLADLKSKPLASAYAFDWHALVDALTPWVEFGVASAQLPPTPPGPEGDVLKQVRTVLEVMKVFHGVTSATYYEDGKLVTHSESVFRDLK